MSSADIYESVIPPYFNGHLPLAIFVVDIGRAFVIFQVFLRTTLNQLLPLMHLDLLLNLTDYLIGVIIIIFTIILLLEALHLSPAFFFAYLILIFHGYSMV